MPTRSRMPRAPRALLVLLPLLAAGCTAGTTPTGDAAGGASPAAVTGATVAPASSGGMSASGAADTGAAPLSILATEAIGTLDPQAIAGRDLAAFAGRTVVRTLTAYPPGAASADDLVGDLATDTGTASADGRRWSFTLRRGLAWEDGSPLTCADVAYGVSRSFAPEVTTGVSYPAAYLDIPHNGDGTSSYRGPYARKSAAGRGAAAYDRAVSCDGEDRTITFRLAEPMADFAALVSLPAFAPFPQEHDAGPDADPVVISSGPYRVAGEWGLARGSLALEPNPTWTGQDDPVRPRPLPRIGVRQHLQVSQVVAEVAAGSAEHRVLAWDPAPPAIFGSLTSAGQRISITNPRTQVVDYLVPNVGTGIMRRAEARRALALASDRAAYVRAIGGSLAAEQASSLLTPGVAADTAAPVPPFDPAQAKALLAQVSPATPVPIVVAYRQSELLDAAMAALRHSWESGGFAVTLRPVPGDYFGGATEDVAADVYWGQWGPDFPAPAAILPALFDGSINLTGDGEPGLDYGRYADAGTSARMTSAGTEPDPAKRAAAWRAIDSGLRRGGVYIGLAARKSLYYASADLGADLGNEMLGGAIDLAAIEGK